MMRTPVIRNALARSLQAAQSALLRKQGPDGLWRDYSLAPGPSEDWVTACAGFALSYPPAGIDSRAALQGAAHRLRGAYRRGGWGYNRCAEPDADSTAWALRFLALACPGERFPPDILAPYLSGSGHARTFVSPRAGAWGGEHADVTPVAGLALMALGAPLGRIASVRGAVLASQTAEGSWPSYWWTTDTYATARCLEFLGASGGIPPGIGELAGRWLAGRPEPAHAFEAAQGAFAAATLIGHGFAWPGPEPWVEWLLDAQGDDGAWEPSPALLVPDPRGTDPGPGHADPAGILTTAMAVLALKRLSTRIPG